MSGVIGCLVLLAITGWQIGVGYVAALVGASQAAATILTAIAPFALFLAALRDRANRVRPYKRIISKVGAGGLGILLDLLILGLLWNLGIIAFRFARG